MNKKGFISLLVVLTIAGMLPLFMFVAVDYVTALVVKETVISVTEEAMDIAITRLNKNALSRGDIEIIESEAREYIVSVLAKKFNLSPLLVPYEDSVFEGVPEMSVHAINLYNSSGYEYQLENGNLIVLYEPSLYVEIDVPLATSTFKRPFSVKASIVKSLGFFNETTPYVVHQYEESENGVHVLNAINPYRFNNQNPFRVLSGKFDSVPLASGGRVDIGYALADPYLTITSIVGTLEVAKYSEDVSIYRYIGGTYSIGDVVEHEGRFYKSLGEVVTNGNESELPGFDSGLWVEVSEPVPIYYNETLIPVLTVNQVEIDGSLLRLDTVPTPQHNHIGVFKVTNSYDIDIPVGWIQGTQTGTVMAKANSETYFELKQELLIAYAYGDLLQNGVLTPTKLRQNPRQYVPVNANNGAGYVEPNIYRAIFTLPYDTPLGAVVTLRIDTEVLNALGYSESVTERKIIGITERNLFSTIKYK